MTINIHEYTFPSSGVTVKFRQVSVLVAVDVRAAWESKKPKPPMEQVELAGAMTEQPNEDDPDYVEELNDWEEMVQGKINETFARRSKLQFEYPDWKKEVDEYRADIPTELSESDEWIFLTRIISAGPELQDFFAILSSSSSPSTQAVQAAKDSFRTEL